ncbi:glycosyltransferase 87 family protein [Zhihengliuella sp.]|uniref:glycosyltransferase family 87 protein n=1 Tax=Zhihengliuella sp. TaxID=1954483 RepID=UPI002811C4D9|nr:glycosyltransferase 87 family protein [Zhihengliuella sp.]
MASTSPRPRTPAPRTTAGRTPAAPAPARITAPSRNDSLLRRFTEVVGGPLGRHTEPGVTPTGFWTIDRVLIALTMLGAILAVGVKNACRVGGWTGLNAYQWACYSDFPALYYARGLAENPLAPFLAGSDFEYPVLMSAVASFTAALVTPGDYDRSLAFFDVNVLFIAVLWAAVVLLTARTAGRRPWDAAMVALAPGMILASTINWDLWAVAALAGAMYAFGRERTLLAGVLIGLGTATKLYPVLFLGAVLVLALRTGRWRAFGTTAAGAAGAWLAVNLPVMAFNFEAWSVFWTFTREREAGWSSLWHAWNTVARGVGAEGLSAETINSAGFWLFFLACVAVAVLGLAAPRRPRIAQLAFLIVASFILFNKVYSPQFVVWLVPLAVLALPGWRDFLVWQFFEVLHFFAIWAYLYSLDAQLEATNALAPSAYVLAVAGHMLSLLYLMGRVVHGMLAPEADPVRRTGAGNVVQDDPAGGPFAGAADRLTLASLRAGLRPAARGADR